MSRSRGSVATAFKRDYDRQEREAEEALRPPSGPGSIDAPLPMPPTAEERAASIITRALLHRCIPCGAPAGRYCTEVPKSVCKHRRDLPDLQPPAVFGDGALGCGPYIPPRKRDY